MIALVVPTIDDHFYLQAFDSMQNIFREHGYRLCLFTTDDIAEYESACVREVLADKYAGMFLVTSQPNNSTLLEEIRSSNTTHTVFLDRAPAISCVDFVGMDTKNLISDIISNLSGNAPLSCAVITGSLEYSSEKNFLNAILSNVPTIQQDYIIETSGRKDSAFLSAFNLLQAPVPPQIVFASTSLIAEGISKALDFRRNPEDIKHLICLSGNHWSSHTQKNTEYIFTDYMSVVNQAVSLMLESIDEGIFHTPVSYSIEMHMDHTFDKKSIQLFNDSKNIVPERTFPAEPAKSRDVLRVLMLDNLTVNSIKALLPAFTHKYSVDVEFTKLPYDRLYSAINKEASNNYYDLFCVDLPWVSELANKGVIENITPRLQTDKHILDLFTPQIMHDFTGYEGEYYGIPYFYCAQLLFYRKDLFENLTCRSMFYEKYKTDLQPPKTWVEYNAIAEFFTKKYNPDSPVTYGTTLGSRIANAGVCEFFPRLWAYNGTLFENNRFQLNSPAAVMALEDLKPARMGWAIGNAPIIAFVRRFRMKDGSVMTNPGVNNPDIVAPIGDIDERVNVLRFDREGAESIVVVNFGNHPDTVGGNKISGDWPTLMRHSFEKAIDNVKCMMFNGVQGDVNHVNVHPTGGYLNDTFNDFDDVSRGYGHTRFMGRVVAAGVMQVFDKVCYVDVDNIRSKKVTIKVPSNMPTPEQIPEAHRINDLHLAGKDSELPYKGMMLTTVVAEAGRMVKLEHGPEAFEMELTAIAIGNLVMIGLPGEPFTGIGRALKEAKGWDLVLPSCLTNGSEGYFPMQDAYDEGGYEARSSRFAAGVAEFLVKEGTKLLDSMR
ncbi:MAG: extracellular solute-binding protein [Clostridia bacterium]|nr:extracellular solute-binding protein [Clostridia bacterium]